ncbi:DUF5666 domain-containing protein [Aurantivibrio infirmus]
MKPYKVFALSLFTIIASCGGGGGGGNDSSVAGISGTGITATGTIDGFGSIFVNGIEFETNSASVILDSSAATETDLRLGMVVTVRGTVNADGTTGTADSVNFDDEVQGPISSILNDADGISKTLNVLGVSVFVDKLSTVFDGVSFDTLAINDVVEVSGFFNTSSVLVATRVEKKENFVAGSSEIEVKGSVTNLNANQFTLGSFNVDFTSADLSDIPSGNLSDGLFVEVKGTLSGTTITATRIEIEDGLFDNDEGNVSVEGLITDFIDAGNFKVSGQSVNAASAQLFPASLILRNGIKVEVEGNIANGILAAQRVEARGGEIRLSASIQSLNINNNSGDITLAFSTGNLVFSVNSQTELRDQTGNFNPLTLADLRTGDFLEVRAFLNNAQITATEVRLDDPDDDIIQGPVESFVSGNEIVIFGITFSTPGEIFEDANDAPISSSNFFSQLTQGMIVKIKDDSPANGVADEVEFEN